jgi:hypothetical protein
MKNEALFPRIFRIRQGNGSFQIDDDRGAAPSRTRRPLKWKVRETSADQAGIGMVLRSAINSFHE